jgi:hypothetical protein
MKSFDSLAAVGMSEISLAVDPDPAETAEWRDAFLALAQTQGPQRARQMLVELARLARQQRIGWQPELATPYVNTIAVEDQPPFPGDLAVEERLASLMRWNALAMVAKANQAYGELGGHIASYASAADLFETGFNHFFHARSDARRRAPRRPRVLPAAQRTRCLCTRVPRRPPERRRPEALPPGTDGARLHPRQRRTRPQQLPASVPDAGLLAVPHRLDGHRPDQLDLPRALHALPHAPQPA